MVNFLSSWVKNLALALIIVSILEMILPNNKTKKYVKMIMRLYILFSIISPFIENSNKLNINNDITVLSSTEMPVKTGIRTPASYSVVPNTAGILIADYILKDILNDSVINV